MTASEYQVVDAVARARQLIRELSGIDRSWLLYSLAVWGNGLNLRVFAEVAGVGMTKLLKWVRRHVIDEYNCAEVRGDYLVPKPVGECKAHLYKILYHLLSGMEFKVQRDEKAPSLHLDAGKLLKSGVAVVIERSREGRVIVLSPLFRYKIDELAQLMKTLEGGGP